MIVKYPRYFFVTFIVLISTSFSASSKDINSTELRENGAPNKHNHLTTKEKEDGWVLLFDGKTLNGWHVFQHPDTKSAWEVKDGMLTVNMRASDVQHGDFATNKEFEDYELTFEWKTPEDGNSGVFINVQEDPESLIAWQTGPEYQLLGSAHADNANPKKRSGGIFGFVSPLAETTVRDNGNWNQSVIKQVDGKVEFYLNGNLTTNVDFTSGQWKDRVTQSRFSDYSGFGASTKGHIVLQEWTSPIYFRNIKIKEL